MVLQIKVKPDLAQAMIWYILFIATGTSSEHISIILKLTVKLSTLIQYPV